MRKVQKIIAKYKIQMSQKKPSKLEYAYKEMIYQMQITWLNFLKEYSKPKQEKI